MLLFKISFWTENAFNTSPNLSVFYAFFPYYSYHLPPYAHHLRVRWRRPDGAPARPPCQDGAPCLQAEGGGRRLATGEPQARRHGVRRRGRYLQERAFQTASVL